MKRQLILFIFLFFLVLLLEGKIYLKKKNYGDGSKTKVKVTACSLIIKSFFQKIGLKNKSQPKIIIDCKLNIYGFFMDSLFLKRKKYKMIRFFNKNVKNTNLNEKKFYFDRILLLQNIFNNII